MRPIKSHIISLSTHCPNLSWLRKKCLMNFIYVIQKQNYHCDQEKDGLLCSSLLKHKVSKSADGTSAPFVSRPQTSS